MNKDDWLMIYNAIDNRTGATQIEVEHLKDELEMIKKEIQTLKKGVKT